MFLKNIKKWDWEGETEPQKGIQKLYPRRSRIKNIREFYIWKTGGKTDHEDDHKAHKTQPSKQLDRFLIDWVSAMCVTSGAYTLSVRNYHHYTTHSFLQQVYILRIHTTYYTPALYCSHLVHRL